MNSAACMISMVVDDEAVATMPAMCVSSLEDVEKLERNAGSFEEWNEVSFVCYCV